MRVMGVDPGTLRTGVGIVEKQNGRFQCVFYETLKAPTSRPFAERLYRIYKELEVVVDEYKPDVMVLEDVFFFKDFKAAVKIGEARSLAFLIAAERGIEVAEYLPNRVKQSVVGNGHASKEQIQYMVQQLLKLPALPQPDAADALALALCHLHQSRSFDSASPRSGRP